MSHELHVSNRADFPTALDLARQAIVRYDEDAARACVAMEESYAARMKEQATLLPPLDAEIAEIEKQILAAQNTVRKVAGEYRPQTELEAAQANLRAKLDELKRLQQKRDLIVTGGQNPSFVRVSGPIDSGLTRLHLEKDYLKEVLIDLEKRTGFVKSLQRYWEAEKGTMTHHGDLVPSFLFNLVEGN